MGFPFICVGTFFGELFASRRCLNFRRFFLPQVFTALQRIERLKNIIKTWHSSVQNMQILQPFQLQLPEILSKTMSLLLSTYLYVPAQWRVFFFLLKTTPRKDIVFFWKQVPRYEYSWGLLVLHFLYSLRALLGTDEPGRPFLCH